MALERERVAVRRSRSIALGASTSALVCLILLGIILQYVILVRRKNKALVSQISENVILQREKVDASASSGNPELSSLSDAQLFEYLRYEIVTNCLYADSRLDRQYLMDRYHLSKERIGSAFSSPTEVPISPWRHSSTWRALRTLQRCFLPLRRCPYRTLHRPADSPQEVFSHATSSNILPLPPLSSARILPLSRIW